MVRVTQSLPDISTGHVGTATYAWHAHDHREVLTVVNSSEAGLKAAEARERLRQQGPNEFTKAQTESWLARLFRQFTSPMTFILLAACLVTTVLGEYLDAGVIALALLIAVVVSMYQEGKASSAFATLAASQKTYATVWRDGTRHRIDARAVVVGDVVELQAGEQVPADIRLTKTKALTTNEAALTGEWLPTEKDVRSVPVGTHLAEQHSMVFKGTFVASGYGVGVVIATGDATEVGTLAHELQSIESVDTPIQLEMKRLSRFMLYLIGSIIAVLFVIGVWYGQPLEEMALMAIAVAVAAIPEGLPAAVTIILAVGMEALLKRGGLVRNLLAAETLGSTTYVLTDKTGTLTEAKMAVTAITTAAGTNAAPKSWRSQPQITTLLNIALCATDAYTDESKRGVSYRGEPVELAILQAAQSVGISESDGSFRAERTDYLAFTSENRFAAGLVSIDGLPKQLCVNGAPELLLESAGHILVDGEQHALDEATKEAITTTINEHTSAGRRLIAVGYVPDFGEVIPDDITAQSLNGMVFVGLVILADPVRSGVKKAITSVQSAGAQVILITGDNPATALTIARKVGITSSGDNALTGSELEALSDVELLTALAHVRVFARVLPKQKQRIAEVLQQQGEIVAMTGDGINDAPALQRANIGIATGSGTQVAQAASDLVLVNDSFTTIHAAIEEGRRIIANLRKVIGYLLSTSLSEVVLIAAALLSGGAVPLTAVQILWANIIEEGLMSVAFAFEPGEKNAMKRKPQDIHAEGLLSKTMLGFLALVIAVLSSFTVGLYFYLRELGLSEEMLRSAMFLSVAADSLFIAWAFRSLTQPVWRIPFLQNRFFIGSFLLSTVLLFGALSVPFMREVLSYVPLPAGIVVTVFTLSALGFVVVEVAKWIFFERNK